MAIIFIAFGILFGAGAAVATLWTGGSILLAIAAYSAVGTLGALAMVIVAAAVQARQEAREWTETKPVSA